jgi:serine/threonine-protein kinase
MLGVVIGNYRVVRKLGEGGMGAVYLAEHTLLGRKAAIKVLLPALSQRADVVNRFFNEARAVTSISDAGIVQVFDFGYHTDGSAFIVMEFLEGESLDARLNKLGRLPAVDALRLCRQVATSLAAAHALNIVHRDLKPENIYLVKDLEVVSGERPKILDFGIAKLSDDHPGKLKTQTGALMGTPLYMSPEQCRGAAALDHRSDIYALGCVMFHLLVGAPPFDGEGMGEILAKHMLAPVPAPSSRLPGLQDNVDRIVMRCLAKEPAERFQSMNELVAAISHVLPHTTSPDSTTKLQPAVSAPLSWPGTAPTAPTTPTTIGSSSGQVVKAPRAGRLGWLVGAILIAAIVGVAIFKTRDTSSPAAATPISDAAAAASNVVKPDAEIRAALPPAPPIDAAAPPIDATPADAAAPPDAQKHTTPNHPHKSVPAAKGSAAGSDCDRKIDSDCDGIPDVR